jgi:hypothetical protein
MQHLAALTVLCLAENEERESATRGSIRHEAVAPSSMAALHARVASARLR